MQDPDDHHRRRRFGLLGMLFVVIGSGVAVVDGSRLIALPYPWGSNDLHWAGLFMGILFAGFGCLLIWDWLFAPPLTNAQRHFRDEREAWERERRRLFGDGKP